MAWSVTVQSSRGSRKPRQGVQTQPTADIMTCRDGQGSCDRSPEGPALQSGAWALDAAFSLWRWASAPGEKAGAEPRTCSSPCWSSVPSFM